MNTDPVSDVVAPVPSAPGQPRTSRAVPILLGTAALAGCFLLAALIACVVIGAAATSSLETQQKEIEPVIDEFMTAMAARDTDRAYALFSARGQQQVSAADVSRLAQGNNYMLFDGYQSVELLDATVGVNSDSDVTAPQGLVAQVSGSIHYAAGFTGSFEAILEHEGESWRLYGIDVSVPPEKFGP